MTVATSTSKSGPYNGAGTTGPFPVDFRFLENSHLQVVKTTAAGVESVLVLDSAYTVSGAGASTGSVTLIAALPVGEKLTITRKVPATQEADYVQNDAFPAESHETALDKLTMLVQQNSEVLDRAIKLPVSTLGIATVLPRPLPGHGLKWSADGFSIVNTIYDLDTVESSAAGYSASAAASANAAMAALDSFDDRYLGVKATDPLLDNDGFALTEGTLYWNSTAKEFRVYNGAIWQSVVQAGNLQKLTYVAGVDYTAGATTSLVLPTNPLVKANLDIVFDAAWQQMTEYSLAGTTVTFNSPIPVGVAQVEISYTVPLQIGTPSDGTVTVAKLAAAVLSYFVKVTDLAASAGASLVGFLQAGIGAVLRTAQSKLRDTVSVKDFGAKGDGVTDDTAAFKAAALAFASIYIPEGNYLINDTIVLSKYGAQWQGAGRQCSVVTMTVSNKAAFKIQGGNNGPVIRGFSLDRSVVAVSGGDGIYSADGIVGQAVIEDMIIMNQWRALNLGPTDYSTVRDMILTQNYDDGVYISNQTTGGSTSCQWYLYNILAQRNNGVGFRLVAGTASGQTSVGSIIDCATYANKIGGLFAIGYAGGKLMGLRVSGGFYGEDGNHCIFLDTFGDHHVIQNVYMELAGTAATGRTVSTPASNIGAGLFLSSNNGETRVTGCSSHGNSQAGYSVSASSQILNGCVGMSNGNSLTQRFGVISNAGRLIVNGCAFGNTGASTNQNYGVFVADGQACTIIASDLTGNMVAAFEATANRTYIGTIGNLPNTLNVGIAPAGAVLIGGGATGGFGTAGTLNAAGDLRKNNVIFTNP